MRISLLTPTRGRPDNVLRLHGSVVDTAARPDEVEMVFRVDEDDGAVLDVLGKLAGGSPIAVKNVVAPRPAFFTGELWNECWRAADGEIYQLCGDDIVFRTPGWDDIVRREFEAVPDRILLVYGQDGIQNERLATHGFLHKGWTDVLGYFTPSGPGMTYYNDTWMFDLATRIGRARYVPEILTEHMHHIRGKAKKDATYVGMEAHWPADCRVWQEREPERAEAAAKLAGFIDAFKR